MARSSVSLPMVTAILLLPGQPRKYTGSPVSEEVLRPLLEVRPEYLAACFDEINNRYQSKEHFFETALDLDEAKLALLRERYLH